MRSGSLHQILVGASSGDAITGMARAIRGRLRSMAPSEIFAHYRGDDVPDILPLHDLDQAPGEALIYHASYGEPLVTEVLLGRREPLVLLYHNITPARFLVQHDARFAAGLEWGRYELGRLRPRVRLAIADSTFNADDLRSLGYDAVRVVPVGLQPHRLVQQRPDFCLADRLAAEFPAGYAAVVSQILPHKSMETALHAIHLVRSVHGLDLGLVIVGTARSEAYRQALVERARRLRVGRVWFTGQVTDAQLATVYRMATLHLTTSRHEGLAIPPLEAMSLGTPVLARAAGALRETIGDGGVVLPEDSGPPLIAEAIAEIATNRVLRAQMSAAGRERAAGFASADTVGSLIRLLERTL